LLTLLVKVLIIGWLPGAVLFRLPIADRDKRAALDAEERLFWAVIISVALSTSLALALAAAHRYSLERVVAGDVVIAALAAAAARFTLRLGPTAARLRLTALFPLALVVLGLMHFFPPSEYVMGGRDPGVYVNEGIQIAQRGALIYDDPVVAAVPTFARPLFFPPFGQSWLYSLRFMGFHVRNGETGAVVGQFPHFFPASIAIGHGLDGLTGARRVVGVWALLGMLAVYFAGARLVGRTAAWAAAVLLSLNVIQIWFARYPNTEVVMQALLFAALLASARAHVDDDRFFAPVAGVLLGLLLFVRFDAILAIVAVLGAVALGAVAGGRVRASFLLTLSVTVGLAIAYLLGPMRAYAELPIVFLSNLKAWQYGVLTLAALGWIAAILMGTRLPAVTAAVRRVVPIVLTIVVLAAALYALYLRRPIPFVLAERDAYALRTFTNFYLTLPGLLAALLGFALVVRRMFWRAPDLFATIAMYSFFFFYKIRIVSDHFWMARRFLPVVLPGALIFAAAAALSGARGGMLTTRTLRTAIGVAFVVLLGSQYMRASAPILHHIEYAGLIPRLEKLAGLVGDRDLLVVESRNASDIHVLALPLADIYDRNVIVLASERPDKSLFATFLEWARTKYARVLFIGGGGTDLLSPSWGAVPVASDRFQIPEYDSPLDAYPRFVRQKEFDYSIYQLTPPDPEAANRPFDLDVGVEDDLYVVRFFAKERTEGRTFRWTKARAFVSITNVSAASREVVLWMSDGGRPPAVPPADVTVTLDGTALGTVRVTTGFKPYSLAIPAPLAQRLDHAGRAIELALTTTVWKPEQVLGTPDDRDLGVMVDRVAVK
jgi:hypothetical protein